MKNLILILALFLITGCGGQGPQHVNIPPESDIRADVAFKGEGDGSHVEVNFYLSTPVPPGDKSMPRPTIVPVEDPRLNGQVLTEATCEAGGVCYTATGIKSAPSNIVTARINGKPHEGKTIPGSTIANKRLSVTMVAK